MRIIRIWINDNKIGIQDKIKLFFIVYNILSIELYKQINNSLLLYLIQCAVLDTHIRTVTITEP